MPEKYNKQINKLFYELNDFKQIETVFCDENNPHYLNIAGKIALREQNADKAYKYFEKANNVLACAYCTFLKGNLKTTVKLLTPVKEIYSHANWILFLINLLEDKLGSTTYFRVRNFYEQDLEMLFFYKQIDFAQKIISKSDFLEKFNREIYKYAARVLLNNNIDEAAKKMLVKSCDICYKDPETHYLLGELEYKSNNLAAALNEFQTAYEITRNYKPALKKAEEIRTLIKQRNEK